MSHLFAHLSPNVGQSLLAIEALGFQTTVSKHLDHLGIFLAVFLEDELSFVIIVLVLATSPVFSSLALAERVG